MSKTTRYEVTYAARFKTTIEIPLDRYETFCEAVKELIDVHEGAYIDGSLDIKKFELADDDPTEYVCQFCGHEFIDEPDCSESNDISPGYVVCPNCEETIERPD